jgi:predicted amidophosphoribosyltransferase
MKQEKPDTARQEHDLFKVCSNCGQQYFCWPNYCGQCGNRLRLTCSACCQPIPDRKVVEE